jgi:hypothetical protein
MSLGLDRFILGRYDVVQMTLYVIDGTALLRQRVVSRKLEEAGTRSKT